MLLSSIASVGSILSIFGVGFDDGYNSANSYVRSYQFSKMQSSMMLCNQQLTQAYRLLTEGKLKEAVDEYQKALKVTYNDTLKANIKCTIAVILHSQGNYDQVIDLVRPLLKNPQQIPAPVRLRLLVNMTLVEILEGKFTTALDYFEMILESIHRETSPSQKQQLIQYTTFLFFRVRNLEELSETIENMDVRGMKVEEVYSLSLMAFNSALCTPECQQRIQRLCYQQLLTAQRYDLAIFSLRSLIRFTKNVSSKQYYEKELAKMVMMGYFHENIDYNNYESYEIIQAIAEQFVEFSRKNKEEMGKLQLKQGIVDQAERKQQSSEAELQVEWFCVLSLMGRETSRNKDLDVDSKRSILDSLANMKQEKNMMIIRSMIKNSYFQKQHEKVQNILKNMSNLLKHSLKSLMKHSFNSIHHHSVVHPNKSIRDSREERSRISLKPDRSRSSLRREDKENNPPLGISIVSVTSSKCTKEPPRKKIFDDSPAISLTVKKVAKMMKLCQHGAFLNKRNFNSEGGEFKFVKITNSFIKWGKDPQKIQTNCQIYPLKDIKSIIYGRVSPNLNESCNRMLSYSKCFSLVLQKRTLDFYCKNYEQLQTWVCGISQALRKQDIKVVGYSPGKLRWKKMFAILKENFIQPLKTAQRNKYYYENAYSLKLFASNGYKLPKNDKK